MDLAPGETLRIAELQGAGRIVRIWMTLPLIGRKHALRDAVLRAYWDGEDAPSIECPLGDFFGAAFGKPCRLVSDRLVIAGGGYLSRFEMPFNDGAILELRNDSTRPIKYVFYQIGYYLEPEQRDPEPTLHIQFRRENPTDPERAFVALDVKGKGWLAGITLAMQNRSWWLRPPLKSVALPRGFGMGFLDGWENIEVDGKLMAGTGAEDYFNGGFYFMGGTFSTPTHGCTYKSFLGGRASAYRFHLDDPVRFERSLTVGFDHGFENCMRADYSSVAFWYQSEPHALFPALPAATERRPSSVAINASQWLILLVFFCAVAGGIVWLAV